MSDVEARAAYLGPIALAYGDDIAKGRPFTVETLGDLIALRDTLAVVVGTLAASIPHEIGVADLSRPIERNFADDGGAR